MSKLALIRDVYIGFVFTFACMECLPWNHRALAASAISLVIPPRCGDPIELIRAPASAHVDVIVNEDSMLRVLYFFLKHREPTLLR